MHFDLLVRASSGRVSGHADITQLMSPADTGAIPINNVTGQVDKLGLPDQQVQVVVLQGSYLQAAKPPLIGMSFLPFSATLFVNDSWNGHGSFTLGENTVSNVPVNSLPLMGSKGGGPSRTVPTRPIF